MTNASDQAPSGRLIPIVLFLLFVGPLATAFLMYYAGDWRPVSTTNMGELLDPVAPVPDVGLTFTRLHAVPSELKDAWWLLQVSPRGCDDACKAALVTTRQVRLSLGHKAERVNRAFIGGSGFPRQEHRDLFIASMDNPKAGEFIASFDPDVRQYIWLIDPLGNVVLRYPLDVSPKHIHSDLKKLLRRSRIG